MEPQVSRDEAVRRVHLPDVRTEPRVFDDKLLRKIVGEDEKLTFKSNVDLARLPSCHSALKPHIQQVNHRLALNKRADESILEKPKPYDDGQGRIRTGRECWNRCGPAVLRNQTHWLISWTLLIVKKKKLRRKRKTRKDELYFDDFSESNGE